MKIGLIGTGAISHKHAEAYAELEYPIVACSNRSEQKGRIQPATRRRAGGGVL